MYFDVHTESSPSVREVDTDPILRRHSASPSYFYPTGYDPTLLDVQVPSLSISLLTDLPFRFLDTPPVRRIGVRSGCTIHSHNCRVSSPGPSPFGPRIVPSVLRTLGRLYCSLFTIVSDCRLVSTLRVLGSRVSWS